MIQWLALGAAVLIGLLVLFVATTMVALKISGRALRGARVEVLSARELSGGTTPKGRRVEVVLRIHPEPDRDGAVRPWTPAHLKLAVPGAPGTVGVLTYLVESMPTDVELLSPQALPDAELREPGEVRLTAEVPRVWDAMSVLHCRERLSQALRVTPGAAPAPPRSSAPAPAPAFHVRKALELDRSGREGEALALLREVLSVLPPADAQPGPPTSFPEASIWLYLAHWRLHGEASAEGLPLAEPPPGGVSRFEAGRWAWACLLARSPALARRWLSLPDSEPPLEHEETWRVTEDVVLYLLIRHQEGLEEARQVQPCFERFLQAEPAPDHVTLLQHTLRRALWNREFRPDLRPSEALATRPGTP